MPDLDHRDLRHAELLGRKDSGVPDHHLLRVVHDDRHDEAELAYTVGNLVDLALRVLPRITGIKDKIAHRPILNFDLNQASVCRWPSLPS
jgi:hypothetical protein